MAKIDGQLAVLELWYCRTQRNASAHYRAASWYRAWDNWLTGLNVLLPVLIVGLSGLPFLRANTQVAEYIALVSLSLLVSSIAQFLFDPRSKASDHKRAAEGYTPILREIEHIIARGEVTKAELTDIEHTLDKLTPTLLLKRKFLDAEKEIALRMKDLEQLIFERHPAQGAAQSSQSSNLPR